MASLCLSKPSITVLVFLAVALFVSHNLLTTAVGEDGCGCSDHGGGGGHARGCNDHAGGSGSHGGGGGRSHESPPPPPPLLYDSPPNNNPPPYPPCDNDNFPPLLPLYPYGPFQGCSDLSSGSRLDPCDHVLAFGCMTLVTSVLFFWGHDSEPPNLYKWSKYGTMRRKRRPGLKRTRIMLAISRD